MTRIEMEFYETLIISMREIVTQLKRLNDNLENGKDKESKWKNTLMILQD